MSVGFFCGVAEGHLHAGDRAAAFGVGVGDAEGVGGGAVAEDFAVDRCAAFLGALVVFEDDDGGAFAEDEAVAVEVERAGGFLRLGVVFGEGREQVEARDAEGVDHAVGAAGEHDVGFAAADDFGGLADGLAAGGAGGEAVEVRAFGAEVRGHVGDGHVRFLFELELRVEPLEAFLNERGQVEFAVLEGGDHHVAEVVEILLAFAGAEVDAEAIGVDRAENAGVVHGLASGADRELRVAAALFPGFVGLRRRRRATSCLTSAEMRVGKLLASKSVVKSTPDLPSLRLAQSCGHRWCQGA